MGYPFRVKDPLRVKVTKEYPWPNPSDPDRTLKLFGADFGKYADVLTPYKDGGYMKHTGICCFGFQIPEEDLEPWPAEFLDETGAANLEIV